MTAESTSGEAAADSTAAAGSASDKAAAGADQNTSDPAYGTYEDPAGWYVQYEPSLFSVEKEADGARFLYTGEAVGENYVDIRYIPDREPKEVLTEKIDELIEEWERRKLETTKAPYVRTIRFVKILTDFDPSSLTYDLPHTSPELYISALYEQIRPKK